MKNNIYIIISLILVLILLIILYILFNTNKKATENYSNMGVNSLKPTSYNSTKCKPKDDKEQLPIAYNDNCNMENNLDAFLTPSKYSKTKQLEPALSLHTLPKLHSSKKLLAYNEYCDISQSSTSTNIPNAYNEYCISKI